MQQLSSYDPKDFIVRPRDPKGHSERVWVRIQPAHDRQLDVVLSSKKFPYQTKSDIIRHAIKRHFDWLDTLAPDLPSITRQAEIILELGRIEQFDADFEEVFKQLGVAVGNHLSRGAIAEAQRVVRSIKNAIMGMPRGYWRDRYFAEMKSRWEGLLHPNELEWDVEEE